MWGHINWIETAIGLANQLGVWINSLSQGNAGIALATVAVLAALSGLIMAAILRLLRVLLPWLVLAGTAALCWHLGLLDQCWQWLMSLGW